MLRVQGLSYGRYEDKRTLAMDVMQELETRRQAARAGGGQRRVEAQHGKGKLTARERVE